MIYISYRYNDRIYYKVLQGESLEMLEYDTTDNYIDISFKTDLNETYRLYMPNLDIANGHDFTILYWFCITSTTNKENIFIKNERWKYASKEDQYEHTWGSLLHWLCETKLNPIKDIIKKKYNEVEKLGKMEEDFI